MQNLEKKILHQKLRLGITPKVTFLGEPFRSKARGSEITKNSLLDKISKELRFFESVFHEERHFSSSYIYIFWSSDISTWRSLIRAEQGWSNRSEIRVNWSNIWKHLKITPSIYSIILGSDVVKADVVKSDATAVRARTDLIKISKSLVNVGKIPLRDPFAAFYLK